MTDEVILPDEVVRTALQLLPIPPHGEGFWADVDRALDAEEGPPRSAETDTQPTDDEPVERDRAIVPVAFRRPGNVALLALATAAAVLVGVAGAALLSDRDTTRPADQEVATGLTTLDLTETETALPEISSRSEEAATEAVVRWVGQVQSGAATEAWDALGPTARDRFGTEDAFAAQLATMAGEYAPWSGDPDDVVITPMPGEEVVMAVVTLVGTLVVDGELELRADVFPVRIDDDEVQIEPAADGTAVELVAPAAIDGELGPTDEVIVVVPTDAAAPVLRLDDSQAVVCGEVDGTELTVLEDAPGIRCSYQPVEPLASGDHTLTVAYQGADDGVVAARSVVFEAA
jgi:hypothetical protein